MIAVIFEVWPADTDTYLDIAGVLSSELEQVEGFISIERFESLSQSGKLLSLSFWRDEKAVREWRNRDSHRRAQRAGIDGVLNDYRLRVAGVVRDYSMAARAEAPKDSRKVHDLPSVGGEEVL